MPSTVTTTTSLSVSGIGAISSGTITKQITEASDSDVISDTQDITTGLNTLTFGAIAAGDAEAIAIKNLEATNFVLIGLTTADTDSGTATAGAATTLTDAGKAWRTNEWANATVHTTGGTGSGQSRVITSNTATVLTVPAWGTNPDATTTYAILLPFAKLKAGASMLIPLPALGLSAMGDTATCKVQKWAAEEN